MNRSLLVRLRAGIVFFAFGYVAAQAVVREGKTQDELGKVMTAEFNWQPNSVNFAWSLAGMMVELT